MLQRFWYRSGGYKISFWQWLAWKLPTRLVYFAAIRLWAYGTTNQYAKTEASALTMDEAIRRWPGNESNRSDGT